MVMTPALNGLINYPGGDVYSPGRPPTASNMSGFVRGRQAQMDQQTAQMMADQDDPLAMAAHNVGPLTFGAPVGDITTGSEVASPMAGAIRPISALKSLKPRLSISGLK